jgi:hypothetical protein
MSAGTPWNRYFLGEMSAMTRQRFVLLPLLLKNPAKSIPSFSCLLQTVLPISLIINTVYALSKRFFGSEIYTASVYPETLGNFQKSEVGAFPEQIVRHLWKKTVLAKAPETDCFYLIRVTMVQDYYLFRERLNLTPGICFADRH